MSWISPSTVAITTTGISSPLFPVCNKGSSTSMEFFIASALAISCGRKYLPWSKYSPTRLIAGSRTWFNNSTGFSPLSSASFVIFTIPLRFPFRTAVFSFSCISLIWGVCFEAVTADGTSVLSVEAAFVPCCSKRASFLDNSASFSSLRSLTPPAYSI